MLIFHQIVIPSACDSYGCEPQQFVRRTEKPRKRRSEKARKSQKKSLQSLQNRRITWDQWSQESKFLMPFVDVYCIVPLKISRCQENGDASEHGEVCTSCAAFLFASSFLQLVLCQFAARIRRPRSEISFAFSKIVEVVRKNAFAPNSLVQNVSTSRRRMRSPVNRRSQELWGQFQLLASYAAMLCLDMTRNTSKPRDWSLLWTFVVKIEKATIWYNIKNLRISIHDVFSNLMLDELDDVRPGLAKTVSSSVSLAWCTNWPSRSLGNPLTWRHVATLLDVLRCSTVTCQYNMSCAVPEDQARLKQDTEQKLRQRAHLSTPEHTWTLKYFVGSYTTDGEVDSQMLQADGGIVSEHWRQCPRETSRVDSLNLSTVGLADRGHRVGADLFLHFS